MVRGRVGFGGVNDTTPQVCTIVVFIGVAIKARFHETTNMDKLNQRCIQIDRWVMQTCRHRQMDLWRSCGGR